MDTPDKAATLADPDLADAINKEHLLASASLERSSQYCRLQFGRQHHQLGLSTSGYFDCESHYGAASGQLNRYRENEYCNNKSAHTSNNQYSWLLRNLKINRAPKCNSNNNNNCSININLYDNISFSSTPSIRPLSSDTLIDHYQNEAPSTGGLCHSASSAEGEQPASAGGCCFGKFRIFLAFYLLLGITLSIYSRNVLSLAAVKMVANNEIQNGLFALLSSSDSSALIERGGMHHPMADSSSLRDAGSCPAEDSHNSKHNSAEGAKKEEAQNMALASYLPVSIDRKHANRSQLTNAFGALIKKRVEEGELVDWSPSEQGLVFAAGSVGNLFMSIPLSLLGQTRGTKWIIFVSVLGATLQAALMPVVSNCHVSLVVLFQMVFNGLTYGADCVSYTLFTHWLTPTEVSFFVACLMPCYQLGNIMSGFITSKLLEMDINWCWCFYTPAALCGLWTLFWALLSASEPSKSWLISAKEMNFLQRRGSISQMINDMNKGNEAAQKKYCSSSAEADANLPIDWLKLAKDSNIWALIAIKFSIRWFFSVYASHMPTYLSSVLHMPVGLIGTISVVKSSIGLVVELFIGYLAKSAIIGRPFNLSLAAFRKIFQSIVCFGLSLSLLVILVVDCNWWVTISMLILNGICINFCVAGAIQVPLDLSPKHCGLIHSITTTLALGQAIGAPISGLILNGGPADRSLWRIVWLVSILLNTLSGLLFIFLVDSKPKDYNKHPVLSYSNLPESKARKREDGSTKIN